MSHKASLNNFKRIVIIQDMFSDLEKIKLEISNCKISVKTYIFIISKTLPNFHRSKKKSQRKMKVILH